MFKVNLLRLIWNKEQDEIREAVDHAFNSLIFFPTAPGPKLI